MKGDPKRGSTCGKVYLTVRDFAWAPKKQYNLRKMDEERTRIMKKNVNIY